MPAALAEKAIIVTGAGYGLGRAYAQKIAAEGGALVINDIDQDRLEETETILSQNCAVPPIGIAGSIADWEMARELIVRCEAEYGRVDGLVNNAGIIHVAPCWDESEDSLRNIVDVNVLGSMFCGTLALRSMVKHGSGSIVNICSGALGGLPGVTSYGVTKGAVASMVYGWAAETESSGVRVNAVMPVAATGMGEQLQSSHHNGDDGQRVGAATADAHVEQSPAQVAPLVAYLLSDLARDINAHIIRHDGARLSIATRMSWDQGVALPDESLDLDEIDELITSLRS